MRSWDRFVDRVFGFLGWVPPSEIRAHALYMLQSRDMSGLEIYLYLPRLLGDEIMLWQVHNALHRLKRDGLVASRLIEPRSAIEAHNRGGRKVCLYRITARGLRTATRYEPIDSTWPGN